MMSILTSYIDTSMFGSFKVTHNDGDPRSAMIERPKMTTIAILRKFHGVDIDEYRARHGKEEGEAKFFFDNKEDEHHVRKDNLFLFNGACALWQYALNQGTVTANSALPTPTLLTNANTFLYVSDGGPTAITGTISATNGSGTITTSSGSSGLVIGNNLVITGDSSSLVYTIASGSGTSWVISPVYGGSTASGLAAGQITPSTHSQTTLQGSTNVASQVADSSFPSNPSSAQFNTVTGATNATPVVISGTGMDINANDIVSVVEALGNTGANGTYVVNPASTSSATLLGSVGNGSWTSGGLITKRNVLTSQSTFGSTSAVFQWNCWSLTNGNGSNRLYLNNRIVGLGSKASGTSSALKVGISIS
jgi:hypothetical protein